MKPNTCKSICPLICGTAFWLQAEQVTEVEGLVNGWIQEEHDVTTCVMPIAEAKAAGAVAMFGEKYGETVSRPSASLHLP